MNKMVKIHLILATIFSISCNSWSTNQNNNINNINETNSNNNINEVDLSNIDIDKLSPEQCEAIIDKKYEQFQENLNKVYIIFFNSYIKLCNLIYKEHSKLIEEFLNNYSKYDNKYITISDKNISSFERVADLLGYENKPNVGDQIKCTKLLQDIRNKVHYCIQQYIIKCSEKENDIMQHVKKIKENCLNIYKLRKEQYISEMEKCYNYNHDIYFYSSLKWYAKQPASYMLIGAISQHHYNFKEDFMFLSDIERLLQYIINYDIIPSNEKNNRKIDLRYFDSYEAPSGFKSKAVGSRYYNLTNNFRDMLFQVIRYHWNFDDLQYRPLKYYGKLKYNEIFRQQLLSLCSYKKDINNYIKKVIDTLDIKKISVLHKDGKYVSEVLKITQKLKKSLENIVHNALFENDKLEQMNYDKEMLHRKIKKEQEEKENPRKKIRKKKFYY